MLQYLSDNSNNEHSIFFGDVAGNVVNLRIDQNITASIFCGDLRNFIFMERRMLPNDFLGFWTNEAMTFEIPLAIIWF
jgi:hypothetical protein